MYKGYKFLAVIPARGGSKGVPRKNLRRLAGRSLLGWAAHAAHAARCLDRVILSSEDEEIIAEARAIGLDAPFVRPAELARDNTPGIAPVLHALEALKDENYTHAVLLQPTSPLRLPEDIDGAVRRCIDLDAPACLSVCQAPHPPWWMFTLNENERLQPLLPADRIPARRQDAPPVWQLNGAVYVARADWLQEKKTFLTPESAAFVMPPERSLDIDSELDLLIAEALLSRR